MKNMIHLTDIVTRYNSLVFSMSIKHSIAYIYY